jgi:phosphatidylserine/phosphatidylglycerophosphate/cardiolipin synthase-like enzyme
MVVMTPFIDAGGFRWLRRLFEATSASCQRIVTSFFVIPTNTWSNSTSNTSIGFVNSRSPRATIILHTGLTPAELYRSRLFHAKLVVADEILAYAGSANLLSSGEGLSLETGLLVEGSAAIQVARLVDGVLRVARSL